MAEAAALRRDMRIHQPVQVVEDDGPIAPEYPGESLVTAKLIILANHVVGEAFDVEALRLRFRRRGARRLAHARTVSMALVHLVCGRSQTEVAKCYSGRNRTTASNHMENLEALNDVPEHEAFWDLLEHKFRLLIAYAELPSSRAAWEATLVGIDRALDEGELEGEAVDQARHVAGVFWEERIRG